MEVLFVLHQKYEVEKLVAYKNLNSRKLTKTWGIWKSFFERCNEIAADANVLKCFFQTIYFAYPLSIQYILNYDVWAYMHYTLYMLLHWNWYICNMKLPTKIYLKKRPLAFNFKAVLNITCRQTCLRDLLKQTNLVPISKLCFHVVETDRKSDI